MEQFEVEIAKLKKRVLKMSSLVDEQLNSAIKAFEEEDSELAGQVIAMDEKVDRYDNKIDKTCLRLLALRQPVASDLRYIMSAMTINSNLERIGDISVNLAEIFLLLKKKPPFVEKSRLREMGVLVRQMIKDAIDSFINNDHDLAKKVIDSDDIIDQYNRDSYSSMVQFIKETPENAEAAISILFLCREMERLGDHATNIAENVFFIVDAQMVKHKYGKFHLQSDDTENENDE